MIREYQGLTLVLAHDGYDENDNEKGRSWGRLCDVKGCYKEDLDDVLLKDGDYTFCQEHYRQMYPVPEAPPAVTPGPPRTQGHDLETDILNRFTHHPPTAAQVETYNELRRRACNLALHLIKVVPGGRSQALALTALEEAVMHANAGIARG